MPIPTTLPSDADLIASPKTRLIRAQIVSYLTAYAPTLNLISAAFPSYVTQAFADLRAAIDRWTHEETHAG